MRILKSNYYIGFQKQWCTPRTGGNHKEKADVLNWPWWKFFCFASNALGTSDRVVAKKYWLYTKFSFGAIFLEVYKKVKN